MQSASSILMIRPACFLYNEETGTSNAFQHQSKLDPFSLTELAQAEFDSFVEVLKSEGLDVVVLTDSLIPVKPDAVFPNNWISFHRNGKVVTYPMESRNRRSERRLEIIQEISQKFEMKELVDLAYFENENKFLEGTGSLVLDRINNIAYSGLSVRTNQEVLNVFAEKMNYKFVAFHAVDENGKTIYHTNVMMSIGEKFALVCMETIKDVSERKALIDSFSKTGKELISISFTQMNAFAGNLLQVKSKSGKDLIVLSASAYKALDKMQLRKLAQFGKLVSISIPTIESVGGGSVRCMMAEVFLPSHLPKLGTESQ